MLDNELVRDLNYIKEPLGSCEPCIMGKMSQKPNYSIKEMGTREPLELVHMDLCGPMPVVSMNGSRYFYILVDEYSKYVCVYIIRTKDEAFKKFVHYVNKYENQLGKKIRQVRSDNGKEFINRNFMELFKDKGIHHQRTVAYNPPSNGVAERANRSLLDKARTMLVDAGLPDNFWAEAIMTATRLKNIVPTKERGTRNPYELWYGRKPTVSYIKVFGCMAYYFIPKINRSKLSPRARKGIFIGYCDDSRSYRVYDPEYRKINIVRNVKFDEKVKGSTLMEGELSESQGDLLGLPYAEITDDKDAAETSDERQEDNRSEDEPEVAENETEMTDQAGGELLPQSSRTSPVGKNKKRTAAEIELEHRTKMKEREEELLKFGVRRSARIEEKKGHSSLATAVERVPNHYQEAMEAGDSIKWLEAMEKELQYMQERNVWKMVPRREGIKVIRSKWFYNKKWSNKSQTTYKARLVAVGCQQRKGIHYEEKTIRGSFRADNKITDS